MGISTMLGATMIAGAHSFIPTDPDPRERETLTAPRQRGVAHFGAATRRPGSWRRWSSRREETERRAA